MLFLRQLEMRSQIIYVIKLTAQFGGIWGKFGGDFDKIRVESRVSDLSLQLNFESHCKETLTCVIIAFYAI